MPSLSFDPAKNLTLFFRTKATPLPQVLSFFDANGTPFDISAIGFQLKVKKSQNDAANVLTFGIGSGLVISGNTLTITPSVITIREATYYYQLEVTIGSSVYVWFCGSAIFQNGVFDGVQSTNSVTIQNTGSLINVTISGVGGGVVADPSTGAEGSLLLQKNGATVWSRSNLNTVGLTYDGAELKAKNFASVFTLVDLGITNALASALRFFAAAQNIFGIGVSGESILVPHILIDGVNNAVTIAAGFFINNNAGTFSSRIQNTNTASRTYTLPDASGTLSLTGLAETFSAIKTFSVAPVFNALPTGTAVSNAATASTLVARDANNRILAANLVEGYSTTATAAGTTTLLANSNQLQQFTGTTTQIVVLPVATTLSNGHSFRIVNTSTGIVTVNTSGGNTVKAMAAGSVLDVWCINTAGGTGLASWNWLFTAAINN